MQLIVGIYTNPETRKHWTGWIEPYRAEPPLAPPWIAFVDAQGNASFWDRDESGAIINPPPEEDRAGGQDQIVLDLSRLAMVVGRIATMAGGPRSSHAITMEEALEWAAQVWTRPENAGRTMDEDLAKSIAAMLHDREVQVFEAPATAEA